jgi:hypothetical protein
MTDAEFTIAEAQRRRVTVRYIIVLPSRFCFTIMYHVLRGGEQ